MKILLANKFYYSRGGDCIYTLNLEKLLSSFGHEVAVFAMDFPENLDSRYKKYFPSEVSFSLSKNKNKLESFLRPFGTNEVKTKFLQFLNAFHPDIVHLNNIHTQLSPVLAEIAYKRKIKVIWTLHDYKLLCPRYDCLRNDSNPCEFCFTDKKNVLKYKCMKNSMVPSLIAYGEAIKWNKARLQKYTDAFICPSRFMKDKMLKGGFNNHKLHVLPNFIEIEKTKREDFKRYDYYCYIGRLSLEKGVNTLIRAASQLPYKLKVIGDGPLKDELKQHAPDSNIEFLGHKQWPEIKELVGKARFSVIPSEWYENNPLSVIEALCLGTPVLGANIGGIPELVSEGSNGYLFESGNVSDLKNKIEYMWQSQDKFNYNQIAETSQDRFSSEKYYEELIKIYNIKKQASKIH